MKLIIFITGIGTKTYADNIQSGISDKIIRFHILANSDEDFDQNLKIQVRDEVIKEIFPKMKNCTTKEEALNFIEKNITLIEDTAKRTIEEKGYNYGVKAYITKDVFPMKKYDETVFPAGVYDAVRIEIGKAEGHNWWCVMFPPLCFVEGSYCEKSESSEEYLKEVLTEDEYSIVMSQKDSNEIVPEIKFKIVEWWKEKEQ